MVAGRPQKADPGTLYTFAHQFYWDLRRIGEGYIRWKHDEKKYKRLADEIESKEIRLSDGQNIAIARSIVRDVQGGRITEAEKKSRLREAAAANRDVTRDWLQQQAAEEARKQQRVPGKPGVIKALLRARTPEEIQTICQDAFVPTAIQTESGQTKQVMIPNWPIPVGSVLPTYLSQYASEFIAAKNAPRFPKSTTRPSSRVKQLWFLSRALSGALYGISTRTAINLVGSTRPEEAFVISRASKPVRKQRISKRKSAK
jgi:hypothetical protein